uniref:inositol-3-phosphate synthase n=1 Tax=Lepisosteus oculatus TaxID=7918 RepID=W5MED7_LEPOC
MATQIRVDSSNVKYTERYIEAQYSYHTSAVSRDNGTYKVTPRSTHYTFRTERKLPKLGVMLVGWGGNNGTTVTAAVLANRLGLSWRTKTGWKKANYFGSLLQASTVCLGTGPEGDVFVPFHDLLPMVHPNDIVFDGWDISSLDLARAMERAQVLDWSLQEQLRPHMAKLKPRPSIYIPEFIAANQGERADNVLGGSMEEQMEQIRKDIRDFRQQSRVDKVIVLWTANTERFCDIVPGVNDTAQNLLKTIQFAHEAAVMSLSLAAGSHDSSPSDVGSPQLLLGAVLMAPRWWQTCRTGFSRARSVLQELGEWLQTTVHIGFVHLPSNSGVHVLWPGFFGGGEFTSEGVEKREISGSKGGRSDKSLDVPPQVVIKYVPYVGDSKRAMDEYTSEIMLGGTNTIVIHNTCEDSLLASPIILDLVILTELCQRITFRTEDSPDFQTFHSVLSVLSYLCKAPLVPQGAPVVNALFRQRACIENIMRACLGLPPQNHMQLEHKTRSGCLPQECNSITVPTAAIKKPVALDNGYHAPLLQNG